MAATETRLLLLGGVLLFEPVNGYQLRRELLSWGIEDWAHVNPGSIYSGLATLVKQRLLSRHDVHDRGRDVAVYTSTAAGRGRFGTAWCDAVETVDLLSPLPFHTAMSMMSLIDRETARISLRRRVINLDARLREHLETFPSGRKPTHAEALNQLWAGLLQAERDWLGLTLTRLDGGEFELLGDKATWVQAEDEAWQMIADRRRYLELLSGTPGSPA